MYVLAGAICGWPMRRHVMALADFSLVKASGQCPTAEEAFMYLKTVAETTGRVTHRLQRLIANVSAGA